MNIVNSGFNIILGTLLLFSNLNYMPFICYLLTIFIAVIGICYGILGLWEELRIGEKK